MRTPKPRRSAAARGYDHQHKARRKQLEPVVAAGQAYCTEPLCLEEQDGRGRWIPPGAPWDLAHNHQTGEYRGPSHARCNRSESNRRRRATPPPPPRRWTIGPQP